MWLRMREEGRPTPEDSDKQFARRQKHWEDYHLAKAKALGLNVDIKKFESSGWSNLSLLA